MSPKFSHTAFYQELQTALPTSTFEQRKIWLANIIENNIQIKDLAQLLLCEHKIATRFQWMLSELGLLYPKKLLSELPYLLEFSKQINPAYKTSFASFWRIAGVPTENEAVAIDLLFQWLISPTTNVTTKSRSLWVLEKLTDKYPELKNELKLCLIDQMDKYSPDFKKRVNKVLEKLNQ
ncbi:MAG: hypothetical protein V4613_03815 [Bacteroidota bacterium]